MVFVMVVMVSVNIYHFKVYPMFWKCSIGSVKLSAQLK